ncbi:putative mitochondrial glutamyl-tRNA(Gln) amidotransferase subunit A precursor [Zalerion maritima]|uniref:Glutamyl-tRNA(Gln) amidotransferase subunit A, mitochondrial n=1 Tax=Zalerion maritima TaxID=339359 RepID=A0AAD5WSD9_9PEZI|nr:putative mitochondrial glutamyl-tRNA(Gln) amidotransferase subunit A precursor [Zalerion maritima]
MFPISARSFESDMATPIGLRSQQSVRFVGSSSGVRARHTPNRTSTSEDVGTPNSVETFKPGNISSTSAVDMAYSKPTTEYSSLSPAPPASNYIGPLGITGSANNLDPDDATESPPARYIRRSKSLFAQGNQSSTDRLPGRGTPNRSTANVKTGAGGRNRKSFGPHSLRVPKSASTPGGLHNQQDLSRENQVRDLAVKLARDRWNRGEGLENQSPGKQRHHHHLPSLFFRSNSINDMRQPQPADGQSQTNLPLSLSHHNSPKEASLRRTARKASHSLRTKLRSIFKFNNADADDSYFPDQHVYSQRSHVKGADSNEDTPSGSVVKLRHHNTGSVSRVPSGMISLVDVPEHQAMRSRKGSIDELESRNIGDDKSRVTSWTGSGVTASSSRSESNWTEWDSRRYSAQRDGNSHVPSSPLASPGIIVDSQRVYSALMKRLDETRQLGRIEEQKGFEGSPFTIRPISTEVDNDDNVFTSPPLAARRSRAVSPAPSTRSLIEDDGDADSEREFVHPIAHLDISNLPKIVANRQSAFFGSPTCHLFRTESPYRKALQKSIKKDEDASKPEHRQLMTLGKPPTTLRVEDPAKADQGQECDFYDSSSVYSTDSPLREDAPPLPELTSNPAKSSHGEAKIYLNPPTYCPPVQSKGRIVSDSSSVEWKSWLSSHVSKLEHKSPTRSSPNTEAGIYSPAIMSPSVRDPDENSTEGTQMPLMDSVTSPLSTPRPLRVRGASRVEPGPLRCSSGNIRAPGSPTPRRPPPPTPPLQQTQKESISTDENTPPESKQETAPTPPQIPAKSPMRMIGSRANTPRYGSRSPTPTRASPFLDRAGSSGASTPVRDRPVNSMRSFSGFNQPRTFSAERKISGRFNLQPARGNVPRGVSCASSPGFPVSLDGQFVVGKNRAENTRPFSQDGRLKLRNPSRSPNTPPPVRGMAFVPEEETIPPTNPPQPYSLRLAVKDNIATATSSSLPTTCGSSILSRHESPFEATVVTQLRWRGYLVVGKTNLDQFGMGSHSTNSHYGSVLQPEPFHDFSAGGSSGGSAVAIAQGDADLALGTDTGGSVRLPAAYTGIVGYKPSYGMISRWGVVPYANSLDTVGFLAKDVTNIASVVTGGARLYLEHDGKDPTSAKPETRRRCTGQREGYCGTPGERVAKTRTDLKGLTFGIPLEYNISELSEGVRGAWVSAAEALERMGARVATVSLPTTKHALSAYYVLAPAEASSNLAKYDGIRYGTRGESDLDISSTTSTGPETSPTTTETKTLYAPTRGTHFGREVQRRILLGSYTLSSEAISNYFLQAQRVRRLVRRDFDRVFRLSNPLLDTQSFDLPDMHEGVELEDKFGPPQVDFLLCPTAPTTAPRLREVEGKETDGNGEDVGRESLEAYMNDVFAVPASLAGLPAVSVPVKTKQGEREGKGGRGVAGMQLIAQYWDDARLLSVADSLMKATS